MGKKYFYLFSVLALFCLDTKAQSTNYDLNGDGDIDVADVEVLIDAIKNEQSYDYVDLGLPSGLLWATMNIGADSPEDYGDHFAWGETTPQSDNTYNWDSYKWCKGSYTTFTKYCNDSSYGYNGFTDTKTVLDADDDAATVNWGGKWRMPTNAEFEELINNTTNVWTTQNGVNGYKFTSKTNGNSIFFPAAGIRWNGKLDYAGSDGNYWSSTLYESYPRSAWYLYCYGGVYSDYDYRSSGRSVRPVRQN